MTFVYTYVILIVKGEVVMQVSNAMLRVISTALKSYYYECSRVLEEWDDEPGCFTDSFIFCI